MGASFFALFLAGCDTQVPADAESAVPARGLVTEVVKSAEKAVVKRYPGVLEPKDITSLSFEVAGKLEKLDLNVGQRVSRGEVLAKLDREQFETEIERQAAAVDEASVNLRQAEENLARSETLLKKGVASKVRRDNDRTGFRMAEAQFVQAQKALATARENLKDAAITAPFDGIINSVEVNSFATVTAGGSVISMYDASSFEVSFTVSFDTISKLIVGTPAKVRLADDPTVILSAVVSELGERADTVSSFPIVIELREVHPLIKAGMSVEVSFEIELPGAHGHLIPISAAIPEGRIPEINGSTASVPVSMYVFDPESSTVKRRRVLIAGLRENHFLVTSGLHVGEHVAVAGVSFLHDGMAVRLLDSSTTAD